MHAAQYLIRSYGDFEPLVKLGLIISAFCHDVDHTGRTNIFEVNSGSELAIRYHDRSVTQLKILLC